MDTPPQCVSALTSWYIPVPGRLDGPLVWASGTIIGALQLVTGTCRSLSATCTRCCTWTNRLNCTAMQIARVYFFLSFAASCRDHWLFLQLIAEVHIPSHLLSMHSPSCILSFPPWLSLHWGQYCQIIVFCVCVINKIINDMQAKQSLEKWRFSWFSVFLLLMINTQHSCFPF